jgi:16S rRNA (uracil1498-N3)-methyltransferase
VRVPRIHTPQPLAEGATVTLQPEPSKHLSQVLRLGHGDRLLLFNGDGRDYAGVIESAGRAAAAVRIEQVGEPEPPAALEIKLAIGVSKGERMDLALQKAVELGVSSLAPLFTERSVVRLRDERLDKRVQHWRGVIIAACEQSGRRRLPSLAEPMRLSDWLAEAPPGALLLDHRASLPIAALAPPPDQRLTLLVGPEGGLAPKEREAAHDRGLIGVRMGPRILRTETAPLAAIAAIQALWGDFRR